MDLYGIIGKPLIHSFSDAYFTKKFAIEGISDAAYKKFELDDISALPELIVQHKDLKGFNVTIPYKEQIIPYLSSMSDGAREIGAVNCVQVRDGKLIGYNTDYFGFRTSLLEFVGNERPEGLILGTGGASKAVRAVLQNLGINFLTVSRSAAKSELTYSTLNAEIISTHKLIINTTPLGTFPNIETAVDIPYDALTAQHYLFDLVYNPPTTKFLKQGQAHHSAICNGHRMLVLQAERSWEIFNRI